MQRWVSKAALALLVCAFAAAVASVSHTFHTLNVEPYMDEIFHVPQAQRYCSGDWAHWDPKITTFPGLYLLGAAAGRLAFAFRRFAGAGAAAGGELCTTVQLRAVNAVLATAALPVFWQLAAALDAGRSRGQLTLLTAAAALFPLHFFFAFLYYTDVASTLFTLSTWLAALRGRYTLAGALAVAAVGTRQTNAVWVAFIAAWAALNTCLPAARAEASGKKRDADRWDAGYDAEAGSSAANEEGEGGSMADVWPLLKAAWTLRRRLAQLWPLAAVVFSFAAFVVWNGGIVVGDKGNHVPVRHLAQPLYCLLYFTACLAPVFWTPAALKSAAATLQRRARTAPVWTAVQLILAGGAAAYAVAHGTLVHPFLVADNRHYTFYLWRRLVNVTPWARYALIPAYVYSLAALRSALAHRHPLRSVLLAAASCVVLVPAQLIELRYFTLPCLALLLLGRTPPRRQLAAVVAGFAAVDAITLAVFLLRPFRWPDGSVVRFMW